MSQDLPIPRQDTRSADLSVVTWGGADPAPSGRIGRALAGLRRDHRLPPVLAGLGAVAGVASLIDEWLVLTIPDGPAGAPLRVPTGVADLGGLGVGYLVGLLGLAGAVALALRGTGAARQNGRVAGLGLAAAVLAVLIATAVSLDEIARRPFFYAPQVEIRVDHGRGLVSAFVATVLLAAALHLSGRVAPAPAPEQQPGDAAPGRRGRPRAAEDDLPPPADLTVQPTVPFAHPEPPH